MVAKDELRLLGLVRAEQELAAGRLAERLRSASGGFRKKKLPKVRPCKGLDCCSVATDQHVSCLLHAACLDLVMQLSPPVQQAQIVSVFHCGCHDSMPHEHSERQPYSQVVFQEGLGRVYGRGRLFN